ncbi:MAG: hypothetical protein AMXMBFR44_5860 [Candidatus Campbellbacteria bacterium]
MFALINRLRQKPEAQRRAIALSTALIATACIFVLWLVYFFVRLDDEAATATRRDVEEVSPVQSLSELVSSFFSGFKDRF